jgi:putative heme iron utilization protein
MNVSLNAVVHLLHQSPYGALATHSKQIVGYPFATVLPFVADDQHCPVFLISSLAEHTKNLIADPRASFLVTEPGAASVLTGARLTLVGDVVGFDATPALVARYLRYQPDAEQYLELGGFHFFRLVPARLRLVAGFGHMGWIEEEEWSGAATLALDDEQAHLARLRDAAPGVRLLGLDPYGCDGEVAGQRHRWVFRDGPVAADAVGNAARPLLASVP